MFKKLATLTVLSALSIQALCVQSLAANKVISSITVSVKDIEQEAGTVWEASVTSSYHTEVSDVAFSTEDFTPGKTVTITATISPSEGYKFTKTGTTVSASGAKLASSSVKNTSTATVKLNYTPKITLEAPSSVWLEEDRVAAWDKVDYATNYEVVVTRGSSAIKTLTTTKTELDISNYLTYEDGDMSFKVRAVPKTDEQAKYLKKSAWAYYGDSIEAADNNTVYGGFNGSGSSLRFKDNDGDYAKGWQYIGGAWYYFDQTNGYAQSGWQLINNAWYYLDPNTNVMATGWQYINNYWYFFDGSGAMKTGWIQTGPNSYWYYLDTTYGAMWQNNTTPDGYSVNADGVWVH